MKKIQDAKKAYNEIEIPSELGERVASAIERSAPKKKGAGFYVKVLVAPVAVCAAICIAIGMNGVPSYAPSLDSEEKADTAEAESFSDMPKLTRAANDAIAPAENEVVPTGSEYALKTRSLTRDATHETEDRLPFDGTMEMTFMSGAGAWRSVLLLNPDGTFTGEYSDSDMGSAEEEYPNGTVYICSFTGSFGNIEKKNDYTYSMKLKTLEYDKSEPEEYIKDGIRYVKSGPHGIADGEEFVFYLPDAPVSVLTEEESLWWLGRLHDPVPETLTFYGLINKNTAHGFFSYS